VAAAVASIKQVEPPEQEALVVEAPEILTVALVLPEQLWLVAAVERLAALVVVAHLLPEQAAQVS
jgi:hypothetical protein